MPYFRVINEPPRDTSEFDFWSKMADRLVGGIKQGQKSNYERDIMTAMLAGEPVSEAMDQQQPSGILESLWDRISPSGTYQGSMGDLSPLTQAIMQSGLRGVLRDPLEAEYMRSRIDAVKALAESRRAGMQDDKGKPTKKPQKPLSHTALKTYGSLMDAYITQAYKGDVGDPDYTQENLLGAWESFKTASDYDNLPNNQKRQLWQGWKTKMRAKGRESKVWGGLLGGNEYEWDPESAAVKGASGVMPAASSQVATGGAAAQAVAPAQVTDEQIAAAVEQAKKNLPGATAEEIEEEAMRILGGM